jgi:hypothetical protein
MNVVLSSSLQDAARGLYHTGRRCILGQQSAILLQLEILVSACGTVGCTADILLDEHSTKAPALIGGCLLSSMQNIGGLKPKQMSAMVIWSNFL